MTGLELITSASVKAYASNPGETLSADEAAYGLAELNGLLDAWSARRIIAGYSSNFTEYTLTPSLTPHTIGPTGTFVVAQRPVEIRSAAIVLTNATPNVNIPLTIRDKDWYGALTVPDITSSIPTDLYYDPAWANGKLFLYPVPTTAYKISLETWALLSQATLAGTITFPPGYQDALIYSLAMRLCVGMREPPSILVMAYQKAMDTIESPNCQSPTIRTDIGLGNSSQAGFDWRTGAIR